jgi:hypothetical protein
MRVRPSFLAVLAVLAVATRLPAQRADSSTAAPREVEVGGGLGVTVALGYARSGGGLAGDGGLGGRSLLVGRGRWFARPLLLRSELGWQDLSRERPTCDAECPDLETRRRVLTAGLTLEWHHTRIRPHLYPIAGVGFGYVGSNGPDGNGLGVTSQLGAGVAFPFGGLAGVRF